MLRQQRNLQLSSRIDAARVGSGRPARRGFTLVEMLVAVVILAIGLLGLVSSAAVVTRQIGGGAKQGIAAQTIANRLEKFRSLGCNPIEALTTTTETTRGVYESWTSKGRTNGVLFIADTVKFTLGGTPKKQVYHIAVPCQ